MLVVPGCIARILYRKCRARFLSRVQAFLRSLDCPRENRALQKPTRCAKQQDLERVEPGKHYGQEDN